MPFVPAGLPDSRRDSCDVGRGSHDRGGKPESVARVHPARMTTSISHSVPRLKRLLLRLRGKRIGVLGDMMLDRYLWGTSSRISPEAPVPVVDFLGENDC